MSKVDEYHHIAMDCAAQATMDKMYGRIENTAALFRKALENELAAISAMREQDGLWWSVLHRSAATLALDCDDFRLAERLACKALAGDPPPEIAEELRELLEQVFARMPRRKAGAA